MFWKKLIQDYNYKKSNAATSVRFLISGEAKKLAQMILQSSGEDERERLSEALLDELSDAAKIDIVELKISDANQKHRKLNGKIVMKQYGFYRIKHMAGGVGLSHYICITNRTAARGQILAPKTFLDTLLHEWLHHYDFKKLKINSIHSRGFYERLNDLKRKLEI